MAYASKGVSGMTAEEYEAQKPPLNVMDSPEFIRQMTAINSDDNARRPVFRADKEREAR